jgi:dihydroorotase
MNRFSITRPDDFHLHLRDCELMRSILPDTVRRFGRAIIMPNLEPPVTTVAAAAAYRQRILEALAPRQDFEALMTLYLTDATPPAEIGLAKNSGFIHAVKYYPAGATTNSARGVRDIHKCAAVLEAMQELGVPLLVHGEVTDPAVDVFEREKVFIERVLRPLLRRFPRLPIVLEHITTADAVRFVTAAADHVAATITAHHLLYNRNALFEGGIRPHRYCLPLLKREEHRRALLAAATSGCPKFFLGTDSAPHARGAKENACGCAGIYSAHAAIELYAEAFDAAGALDKLEAFASMHGAQFYRLPRNSGTLALSREAWRVPEELAFGGASLVPLRAGETVYWRVAAPR